MKIEYQNRICIVGWYYFEELYKKLENISGQVNIIAHKVNNILNNFNYSVIKNVGFEFGAYDWYIKNIWDKKSDVIFMHDDIVINNSKDLKDIFEECCGIDQSYILGEHKNREILGPHGRMIYMSRRTIKFILKKYNGLYYDKTNNVKLRTSFPKRLMNHFCPVNEKVDPVIKNFNNKMISLAIEYELNTRNVTYNDHIIFYKKGKEKIISDKDVNKKKKNKVNIRETYYCENKFIKNKYGKYLKGKKVVIVGSSYHLEQSKQKKKIDSYDIVVRINNGYKVDKKMRKDIGSRVDVLYSSLSDVPSKKYAGMGRYFDFKMLSKNIKWICGTHPNKKDRINKFKKIYLKKMIPLYVVDINKYMKLMSITKFNLTTGFSAICDIICHDIKELYITGFTFFQKIDRNYKGNLSYRDYGPLSKRYKENKNNWKGHNQEIEFEYFKKKIYNDKRIQCDKVLRDLVKK